MAFFNKIVSGALSLINKEDDEIKQYFEPAIQRFKEGYKNAPKLEGALIKTQAFQRFSKGFQQAQDPISKAAVSFAKEFNRKPSAEELTQNIALEMSTRGVGRLSRAGGAAAKTFGKELGKEVPQLFRLVTKKEAKEISKRGISGATNLLTAEGVQRIMSGKKPLSTMKGKNILVEVKPQSRDIVDFYADQANIKGTIPPENIRIIGEQPFRKTKDIFDRYTKDERGKFSGSLPKEAGFIAPGEILESGRKLGRKLKEGLSESFKKVAYRGSLPDRSLVENTLRTQVPQSLDSRKQLRITSASLQSLKQNPTKGAIEAVARQTGDSPQQVKQVSSALRKIKTNFLEYFQNESERVRKLVERKDIKIDDASDPYLKMTLYPGRIGNKLEQTNKRLRTLTQRIEDSNLDRKHISEYLLARHAPERNMALGDGAAGVTTKDAQEVLRMIDNAPEGVAIKEIANEVQEINNQTLDILKESGVITDDLYKTLRNKYKHHVPLNRIMDEGDDIGQVLSGRGYEVKGTGIKRAVGSQRQVADVVANVVTNYEQAILRAEKNTVDQATLAFVRNNQDILGDLFQVVKPKAVGKTFEGRPILERTNDPTVLQLFENGKKVWIKIKDPSLAVALKGIGKEKTGTFLNAIGSFTRLYAGLATRFNPEFFLPNKIRDLQETAVYLASQKGIGFKGALQAVGRDPLSVRDVVNSLRGKDTNGARLYQELKELGGTTGGFGLSTRKQVELNLEKLEKLASSKTRGIANNLVEYIDNWNEVFEDSTRLSVYKQALTQGYSKERAAAIAKEASINFNRMGRGGPVINALWMFSNASIQGSVKMLRSLKNPKVLGSVATIVGGSVAAINQWNEQVDPDWRDKVSTWDRLNGLPVLLPSTDENFRYFTVPVSWGLKPIKVMADYAYDAVSGNNFDTNRMIEDVVTSLAEAYNPAGGNDLVSAMMPTILDVPVEIKRNVAWYGSPIKPDYDPNDPEDIKYFSSLSETATGRASISISEFLQDNLGASISPADIHYAFEQYIGGTGRTVSKITNVLGQIKGEPLPLDEYPLISRFYREKTSEEVGTGAGGEIKELKDLKEKQERERFKDKQKAQQLHEELKQLPKSVANKKALEVKNNDPQVYSALKRIINDEKLNLSYQEKLIGDLGVENGQRSRYIHEQAMQLPEEKRNEYISELQKKKLVSKEVLRQLRVLIQEEKSIIK